MPCDKFREEGSFHNMGLTNRSRQVGGRKLAHLGAEREVSLQKAQNQKYDTGNRGNLMNSSGLLVSDTAIWKALEEKLEQVKFIHGPLVRALRRHIGRKIIDGSYICGRGGSPLRGDNRA